MALINKLTAIGDAIRTKTETTELLTLAEMPAAILGIKSGVGGVVIPEDKLRFSGNCQYLFASDGNWDWFIKAYSDKITTRNVDKAQYMFYGSDMEQISFDINLAGGTDCNHMFYCCSQLKSPPYIVGQPGSMANMFHECFRMTHIPEDWADQISWDYLHESDCSLSNIFYNCSSLRKIPGNLLKNLHSKAKASESVYRSFFYGCKSMDEIHGIPVIQEYMSGVDMFINAFTNCYRLKDVTFEMQEDGTPYVVKWNGQTIDLTKTVGYQPEGLTSGTVTSYDNGITADKCVTDDESYQRLKNDPDWYTTKPEYSRYNKASALRTINSLPDVSSGGANYIKFPKYAGSATDDKACGGLAVAEIAIASSRGWTVTFAV